MTSKLVTGILAAFGAGVMFALSMACFWVTRNAVFSFSGFGLLFRQDGHLSQGK
jgi:hypothetical protein